VRGKIGRGNLSEAMYEGAIRKHAAILVFVARELKVTRTAVVNRIANSKHLQDVVKEVEEVHKDIGQGAIVKGLKKGEYRWVTYYMDRKAKDRGFGQKLETETKLADGEIEAFVAAFGGDLEKLRAVRAALNSSSPGSASYPGPALRHP
jgi:hypothetical protein